ncbi:MAG TPA: hypothetical protein ENN55_02625 [Firmicutes bacterium]|nr:hypothetical protein [Bacillota bacterium]
MKRFVFCILFVLLLVCGAAGGDDKITVFIESREDVPVIKEEEEAAKEMRERVIVEKVDPKKTKILLEQMMDEKMLDVQAQLLKQRVDDMEQRFLLAVLGVMLINIMGFAVLFIMIKRRGGK